MPPFPIDKCELLPTLTSFIYYWWRHTIDLYSVMIFLGIWDVRMNQWQCTILHRTSLLFSSLLLLLRRVPLPPRDDRLRIEPWTYRYLAAGRRPNLKAITHQSAVIQTFRQNLEEKNVGGSKKDTYLTYVLFLFSLLCDFGFKVCKKCKYEPKKIVGKNSIQVVKKRRIRC